MPGRHLLLLAALLLVACPDDGTLPDDDDSADALDDDDSSAPDDDDTSVVDDDDSSAPDDDDSAMPDDDDAVDDDDVAPPPCQDLNCDGWPDLVFANTEDGTGDYDALSYVYWGSATGFDAADRQELPTLGAMGATVADFNQDAWPDIAFASVSDGEDERDRYVDSMVYWGSPAGFSEENRTLLPTIGSGDVTHADMNEDGWLDLIFTNRYDGENPAHSSSYLNDSYVYLGSATGFDPSVKLDIPTFGAGRAAPADLDGDGVLDLAFCNGTFHTSESWIYWGVSDGFDENARTELETHAPEGVTAADLDLDGDLDLIFANFYRFFIMDTDSYVYWNDGTGGFSEGDRLELPTHGATDSKVADLNDDGLPDLVLVNSMTGLADPVVDSVIYWGSLQGLGPDNATFLETTAASEVGVADLDLDGRPDLVFANHYNTDMEPPADSFIYWGTATGFSADDRTGLPTMSAAGLAVGWIPEPSP